MSYSRIFDSCDQLLIDRENDFIKCRNRNLSKECEIEDCFKIAHEYWLRVKREIVGDLFENEVTEIYFFKEVKPRFTCTIEFYSLLYYSILFEPHEHDAAKSFWTLESYRLERFTNDNKYFVSSYLESDFQFDRYFFLRKFFNSYEVADLRFYDSQSCYVTNGDSKLTVLFALERYHEIVLSKLSNLEEAKG